MATDELVTSVLGGVIEQLKQQAKDIFNMAEGYTFAKNPVITVTSALGDDGNTYEDVEILINTRFKRDGIQYVGNGALMLDLTTARSVLNSIFE